MAIYVSEGGKSTIPVHPAEMFPAVCIDIIDLGQVKTTWEGSTKVQHKIVVRWFCGFYAVPNEDEGDAERVVAELTAEEAATHPDAMPLWVNRRFTASLAEASALRPFLETWRGRAFTPDELKQFDLESLLNAPAFIQVSHNTTGTRTYANVDTCVRLPKGMEKIEPPPGYVRSKDRDDKNGDDPDTDMPF